MATQDDDRFKTEGKFTFKIEKFAEFSREPAGAKRISDPIFIRGIPWRIYVAKNKSLPEYMDVYLNCMPENPKSTAWSCEASHDFKILQQQNGGIWQADSGNDVFCTQAKSWGWHLYKEFEELMHPDNGWYDAEKDTITIEADVKAKMPRGVGFDLREEWHRITKDWSFETGKDSICTIEFVDAKDNTNNKEYKVHKNVLALHSDVFGVMFSNKDTKESKESRVTIEDTTGKAIQQMVHYVYAGKLPADFDADVDAAELWNIADKYNIEPLTVHCEELMMNSLAIANVCARLLLADRHNAHSLRIACGQMIRQNFTDVTEQDEWHELRETNPKFLVDTLVELFKQKSDE